MAIEWDPRKAESNFHKHGVRFADATGVFDDDFAITVPDDESHPTERRFITIGLSITGRVLVVVFTYVDRRIRVISARPANAFERKQYEDQP